MTESFLIHAVYLQVCNRVRRAIALLFDLYFRLTLGKLLYSHTDKLSQTLQKQKMSAVSSKRLAMLTETISSLRNVKSFDALFHLYLKEISTQVLNAALS